MLKEKRAFFIKFSIIFLKASLSVSNWNNRFFYGVFISRKERDNAKKRYVFAMR